MKKKKKVWVGYVSSHKKISKVFDMRHGLGLVPKFLHLNGAILNTKTFPDDKKIRITAEEL